jgi:hypothetical protein
MATQTTRPAPARSQPLPTTTVALVLGTERRPQLVRWTTWWASPASMDSYALMTADGPVVVDPEAPTPEGERRLLALLGGPPKATVLTNDMHERAAYAFRKKWGTPVWGPAYGTPDKGGNMDGGTPDHLYEDGDALPGGVRARKIEGGAFRGDSVLVWDAPGGKCALFTGDALNGPFNRANPNGVHPRRGEPGLYLGAFPYYLKHFTPEVFKASVRNLLDEPADLICGSHGDPYAQDAAGALRRLLELDWAPLLKKRRHPAVLLG